jgi:hypothetical protein
LVADLAGLASTAPLRGTAAGKDLDRPRGQTQGGALVHLYDELAQHLGHMEITRDVLVADWAVVVS